MTLMTKVDELKVLSDPPPRDVALAQQVEDSIGRPSTRARLVIAGLGLVVLGGLGAYAHQVNSGLHVTGLNDRVVWGLYIASFVFFIGISMAGTLISAILRLARAEWRRPITRVAESVTVASLLVAMTMIVADMGRPHRLLTVLWDPNLRSPIVWDVLSITVYLGASVIYLVLPLIPDVARLRDRGGYGKVRSLAYRVLALDWRDRPDQRRRLERGIAVMAITVIPAAIAVHSVTAWLFGMTLREGWNSPLMAPYFVASALFSGTAVIVLVLAIVRRVYRLEDLITGDHFRRLGRLLMLFGIGYAYLTFAEYLTSGYKLREGEDELLHHLVQGSFAPLFWVSLLAGTVIPIALLATRQGRRGRIRAVLTASGLVVGGMMLKRFLIVVPSLGLPLMPTEWAAYRPSIVEVMITAASFAAFALIVILLARAVPIVSVTEMAEESPPEDGPIDEAERLIDQGHGDGPDRTTGRRRWLAIVVLLALAIPGLAFASRGGEADASPVQQREARVDVRLKDATGRALPGAAVQLVVDVKLFGERREAVVDEDRTDAGGRASLTYRPAESGRFKGRVRFAGTGMWTATETPVVMDIERPLWVWEPESHGPSLPWVTAWLVLIPLGAMGALLAYGLWQTIAIRFPPRRLR